MRITAAGEELIDEVFPQVMAAEQALLSGLTARQRNRWRAGSRTCCTRSRGEDRRERKKIFRQGVGYQNIIVI
ncbi:hypothetical protein [Saccharopolyspora gregorii]|uniref:hypothetical protein n=1 Tax=Saccharopolyspora gregorii TaxID=33914 RepID=UPI0031EEA505